MSTIQAPLLWVPFKTTSDVSYAPSIRQTITQTYQESADSYKDEISTLDRCRQDALRGSAGSDMTGRDLLYKYFGQLELLELRFPEVRVPFPWKDAFTGKEISQLSLAYEKASVIFNIAATLSSLAAQQNRTSTEGIRRAFHNFRCAAGMFTYINDNFLHAPSTDLSREVVKVLVQLMIAQATEVFVERMTEEKEKKPFGLRARVSTQAAFLYGSIIEDVKELANKGIFERSWTWLVQCKHKYFVSLAQYQRSLADSASSKHGEALTRLQIAETAAKEASRYATSFSASFTNPSGSAMVTLPSDAATSLLELTRTHLVLCNEAKMSEQRDNDLIYHDALPSEAALPSIEKSSVGDPIAIQEVYGAPEVQKVVGQDIFVRLVPLSVHQSASLYSEEKAKLIRTEGERCETADAELVTALEFAGLPASLDKFNDLVNNGSTRLNEMNEPPTQVFEWADTVHQAKETKQVEKMWEKLISIRIKVHSDIENIEQKLDSDARDCEQMRVKYDYLWEQQPTSTFSKTWRQGLKCHREALELAKKSDNQIDEIWQSAKFDLEILGDPTRDSIRRLFAEALWPQQNSTSNSLLDVIDTNDEESEMTQMRNMVTAIQENISRLQAIKKERHGVLQDLKERIQADDISQLLILNRKAQNIEPALFAAELEKFQAHSGRISATIHLQTTAIQELTAHYKSLVESRRGKEVQDRWTNASKKRAQLINRLSAAYQSHQEVRMALSKGNQFYTETETEIAEIQKNVASFVNDRAAERMRMAAQAEVQRERNTYGPSETHSLEHQMTRMNLANPSAPSPPVAGPPPPPLPPQPRAWQVSSSPNPTEPVYQQPFTPYVASSDRILASTTQAHYSSPIASSADPYASLGTFGSTLPSIVNEPHNYSSHSSQGRPPLSVQQNSGPAQSPLHAQYSGQLPTSAPHQYAASATPSVHRQYSGSVPPPVHPRCPGQAPPPASLSQQYSDQAPPGPPYPVYHPSQSYHPPQTYQSSTPSTAAPKPALPPPPPPVSYQSAVAQAHTSNPSYNPSYHPASLSSEAHQYGGQQSLPAANAPPMRHYSSPPHPSRPPVIPPSQQYYPSKAPQSYNSNQPTPSNLNNFTTPSPQPYYDGSNRISVGPVVNANIPPRISQADPTYLQHHHASWQQQGQLPPNLHIPPQNSHYTNSASPPPPGYQ